MRCESGRFGADLATDEEVPYLLLIKEEEGQQYDMKDDSRTNDCFGTRPGSSCMDYLAVTKNDWQISMPNMNPNSHLVVLIHGLDGYATDMKSFQKKLESMGYKCLAPNVNEWKTRDGIDAGARRILARIEEFINVSPLVERISFIAHSLGGLYARQVVYLADVENSPVSKLQYENMFAIATPHVGSRQHGKVVSEVLADWALPLIAARTGKELMMTDNVAHPMLLEMVNNDHLMSLARFKQLVTYSNVVNDVSVHYCTAALRTSNRLKDSAQRHGAILEDRDTPDDKNQVSHETAEMIRATLDTLPWKKYGCFFNRPLLAHTDIIDKSMLNPFAKGVWAGENPMVAHLSSLM
jgi:Putative serine esterase (DUF676)